jgi:hypothetical protein
MPQRKVMRKEGIKMGDTKNGGSNGDKLVVVVPPRPPQRAVARAVSNLGNTWYVLAKKTLCR